jgi:hypothetical protein
LKLEIHSTLIWMTDCEIFIVFTRYKAFKSHKDKHVGLLFVVNHYLFTTFQLQIRDPMTVCKRDLPAIHVTENCIKHIENIRECQGFSTACHVEFYVIRMMFIRQGGYFYDTRKFHIRQNRNISTLILKISFEQLYNCDSVFGLIKF